MSAADNWLRGAALEASDGSIQMMAHLFATFYQGLLVEGVPVAPAVEMTKGYISAMVMSTMARQAKPVEGKGNG